MLHDFNHFRRDALESWKQRAGSDATYGKLIKVFECAGHKDYADHVRKLCYEKKDARYELKFCCNNYCHHH